MPEEFEDLCNELDAFSLGCHEQRDLMLRFAVWPIFEDFYRPRKMRVSRTAMCALNDIVEEVSP